MGMASSSRLQVQDVIWGPRRKDDQHDDFDINDETVANDGVHTQTGEGGPAPDENDEGTDEVTGEVDAPHSREPKTVVKTAHKKGPDSNVDELEPESNRFAKLKRGRPARIADMSARQGNGQSSVTQQGSNGGEQGSAPRRRGRPSKNSSVPGGTSESAASLPMTKTAQDKQKRAAGDSLRRSSRVAAESATQQIAVQSGRIKVAATPSMSSTPGQKKDAVTFSSRGRPIPVKTDVKTPIKTPTKAPTKPEFEVELILGTRKRSGITEYLVKWKGYHVKENTWEPAANLTHCAQALKEFNSDRPRK